jgi:LmbE family N-acetylglucosaminyl deacetylase
MLIDFLRNKRIMIVVAHPDDELLGLGATMNKVINDYGVIAHVVILGEGITSRSDNHEPELWKEELAIHNANIRSAQSAIGYQSVSIYSLPDNRFDTIALLDIIKIIELEKESFSPEIIFTHHGGDVNVDHQRCFEAVITACRPMAHEKVKTIITFETPSGTEWRASSDPRHFIPNMFVNISEENLRAKINAMECYEFEKRQFPHPRSPEALRIFAQRWGITVGSELAEAFCVVRHIV